MVLFVIQHKPYLGQQSQYFNFSLRFLNRNHYNKRCFETQFTPCKLNVKSNPVFLSARAKKYLKIYASANQGSLNNTTFRQCNLLGRSFFINFRSGLLFFFKNISKAFSIGFLAPQDSTIRNIVF